MAFVIPSFPPSIPFLRIAGYLVTPSHTGSGLLDLMRQRIADHRGALYVLFHPEERRRAQAALWAPSAFRLRTADAGKSPPASPRRSNSAQAAA